MPAMTADPSRAGLFTTPVSFGWFADVDEAAKRLGTVPKFISTTVTYSPPPRPNALTRRGVALAANGLPGQLVKLELTVVLYRMARKLPAGGFT